MAARNCIWRAVCCKGVTDDPFRGPRSTSHHASYALPLCVGQTVVGLAKESTVISLWIKIQCFLEMVHFLLWLGAPFKHSHYFTFSPSFYFPFSQIIKLLEVYDLLVYLSFITSS
jgi:hypothetical protein